MDKAYHPQKLEDHIYALWEQSGYFNPDNLPTPKAISYKNLHSQNLVSRFAQNKLKAKSFSIIMPPPNANGSLHIGNAVFVTLQDIMIRYHRMKGEKTLWLPGADHAGFETQVVYDKKLEQEGRSRFDIPKEKLLQEIRGFTLENKKVIEAQLKRLGASCDWSRMKFTLDQDVIEIVLHTFQKLKEDGLVYQGERIVNWCTRHQTSLSDLETRHEEREEVFYYLKYGPFTIGTARPETKFGDKYAVMHPDDARYKTYTHGKKIELDWVNGPITATVIKDKAADPSFGTGAMTITPWHDPIDFEIAKRHKLEMEQIIDTRGKLLPIAGEFAGMHIKKARPLIVEKLKAKGFLDEKKTDYHYKHTVQVCYKCGSIIEPMVLKNQWFLKMTAKPNQGGFSLRDLGLKAVKEKEIAFIPKRFEKIFYHWMTNIKDWNISRQIAWGIPIPGDKDEQVFDTWFSSGQWPFATLMTTGKNDFKTFYPTDVMETGWDILFFWVARMMMLGVYMTGKVPFRTVYLHGLVRDKDRQKMSKSKGNVIDPLGVIDLYGADALRFALVVGNTPGSDPIIYEEKIRGYRNFANKVWNASRFVLGQIENTKYQIPNTKYSILTEEDKKLLKELSVFTKEITRLMDSFKFYKAAEILYHYFWHTFADKIIEEAKPRLGGESEKEKNAAQLVLFTILTTLLKLLHPFMPFVTEAVWQELPMKEKKLLMVEKWPRRTDRIENEPLSPARRKYLKVRFSAVSSLA